LTLRIPEHPVITMRDDQIISGKDDATNRPIIQLSNFLQCDEREESCKGNSLSFGVKGFNEEWPSRDLATDLTVKKSCLATTAWNEAPSHWASNRSLEFGVFKKPPGREDWDSDKDIARNWKIDRETV
jgi:hypothetical protein